MAALRRSSQREPRRGTPADLLVVGLGNPGTEYAQSRHNVGFDAIDLLVARHGGKLRKGKERALVDEVHVDGRRVALAQPQTFMNESGQSVAPLVRRFGIDDLHQLVIVHDELDLPLGRLKVKLGGGLAGHNGLRSIQSHLHSDDFVRIRIGVGKPPSKEEGADHVLKRPSRSDQALLGQMVERAADAVEAIMTDGAEAAMTRFNRIGDADASGQEASKS
jgi:PTH1 family peptidyl-tRNA hydrolase